MTTKYMSKQKTLYDAINSLKTPLEVEDFLQDLLSRHEIDDLTDRWEIVKALLEGKTQRDIRDELGVSISKISRGSTTIKYGAGAFKKVFDRLWRP